MTSEQINAKVLELKQALEAHKAFLESLPNEVVDYLNDSCYYVNGAIDTLEMEIFDIENIECPEDDDNDDSSTINDEEMEIAIRRGIYPNPRFPISDEELEKIRDEAVKKWRESRK